MKTIWKYELKNTDRQEISIPEDNKPLTVQVQNGIPCAWFAVDTESIRRKHIIEIYGTGNPLEETGKIYIGTYQLEKLASVGHVFISR